MLCSHFTLLPNATLTATNLDHNARFGSRSSSPYRTTPNHTTPSDGSGSRQTLKWLLPSVLWVFDCFSPDTTKKTPRRASWHAVKILQSKATVAAREGLFTQKKKNQTHTRTCTHATNQQSTQHLEPRSATQSYTTCGNERKWWERNKKKKKLEYLEKKKKVRFC